MTPIDLDDAAGSMLSEVLETFRRRWVALLIPTILFTSVGVTYAVRAPSVYRAEVLIAPAVEEKGALGGGDLSKFAEQFSGLASLAGVGLGGSGTTKEISIAILNSHGFQAKLIQDLGLMKVFFADRWQSASGTFKPNLFGTVPSIDDAIDYFNDRVFTLVDDRRTGLLKVRVEWYDRILAASWANEIVDRLNASMRKQAIIESRRSLEFLNEELAHTTNVEVQKSIYSLIESQVNKIMLANVHEQYAFQVLDPASAPSERNSIRPHRFRAIVITLMAGLASGAALAILVDRRSMGYPLRRRADMSR